jgi:hypothetical protein
MKAKFFIQLTVAFCLGLFSAFGQMPGEIWKYQLYQGSSFQDDCLICGRPSFSVPMTGEFDLLSLGVSGGAREFTVTNLHFHAAGEPDHILSGDGTYRILLVDGLVNQQEMVLRISVDGDSKVFTNAVKGFTRLQPMIQISLNQSDQNLIQFFSITLFAAPFRELWFTVEKKPGTEDPAPFQPGDLISTAGRVVKPIAEIRRQLGIPTSNAPPAIDVFAVLPEAEIAISFRDDQPISNFGPIKSGDLVLTRDDDALPNETLLSGFAPNPAGNYGLDAVQMLNSGELLFSTATNFLSKTAGTISDGDLLSYSNGSNAVRKTHSELLSRFHAANTAANYGLDAVYQWPSGEIWFSVKQEFEDSALGHVSAGDLLSDQGEIIFRNATLVGAFFSSNTNDLGLDSLVVITDAAEHAPAPKFLPPVLLQEQLNLPWDGKGRAFQIEAAPGMGAAFIPVSPILPELNWTVEKPTGSARYFRLRQW